MTDSRLALTSNRLVRATHVVVLGLSVGVGGSWLLGAAAHVDDGRGVDHVAGSWMALAAAANAGTFYPPLYDGLFYGGTRFAPLSIALQAGAARVTGEYLVSAKLLALVLAVALVTLVFVVVRETGCGTPVALVLTSTLLVSGTGLSATTGIRNDALPVLLQLGALALVARSTGRVAVVCAGGLCALALAGKLSALWAPVAITVWLLRRERRRAATFAVTFGGALAIVFATFEAASAGRMSDNLLGLTVTGTSRVGDLGEQVARIRLILSEGLGPLAVILLIAVAGTALAARRRQLGLCHLAFSVAAIVTAVVLLDPGAFLNHLLDAQVLALPVIGDLWRRQARVGRLSSGRVAIAIAIVLGSVAAHAANLSPLRDARALLEGVTSREDVVPPLEGVIGRGDLVLSEDPTVSVLRGERPVVLDPYMLIAVGDQHPEWRAALVARIARGEFDKVVLYYIPGSAPDWYANLHLGREVVAAIGARYRPSRQVEGYWIYTRR